MLDEFLFIYFSFHLQGGRHIDYISDMIVKHVGEIIKKKNKGGVAIKPFQIKNHLWVFVNCLIVNPTFDSQTKEHMTLQMKSFGSKCNLSDKFMGQVSAQKRLPVSK